MNPRPVPAGLTPLGMTRLPRRDAIIDLRRERQNKRAWQFWLVRWLRDRLVLAAILAAVFLALTFGSQGIQPAAGSALPSNAVLSSPEQSKAAAPAQAPDPFAGWASTPAMVSHYWPPLGGTNCGWWTDGVCASHMADGRPWPDGVGSAAACPAEWAFGTQFALPGGETFTCEDRGGGIVYAANGIPWVDLLVQEPPVPYGSVVTLRIKFP